MIIDFHTHIYPPKMKEMRSEFARKDPVFSRLFGDTKSRMVTAEELIGAMDEAGVDRAVVLNLGWTTNELCRDTNDYILDSAARFSKRLVPFCTVQPREPDEAMVELERCVRGGTLGLGEMRSDEQGFSLADKLLLQPIMERARQERLIISTHSSEPVGHVYPGKGKIFPQELFGLASAYPEVRMVCAHWGGGLPFYGLMPEVMKGLANVWFDTAATPYLYDRRVYRLVTGIVGRSKVLFGSDYPLIDFKKAMADVRAAGLEGDAAEYILGINAERLLQGSP